MIQSDSCTFSLLMFKFQCYKNFDYCQFPFDFFRAILGPNQGPAQWPNCNRYTEATVEKLLEIFASDRRRQDEVVVTKWSLVLDAYHRIRKTILNNYTAMNVTDIQLPLLNKKTLQQW